MGRRNRTEPSFRYSPLSPALHRRLERSGSQSGGPPPTGGLPWDRALEQADGLLWVEIGHKALCPLTCSNRPIYRTGSVEYSRLKRARNQPSYRGCKRGRLTTLATAAGPGYCKGGWTLNSDTLETLQADGENELLECSRIASGLIQTKEAGS